MMAADYADDFRQMFVVTKNEMIKYTRGKKAIILLAIILLIWGLLTSTALIFGDGIEKPEELSIYMGFAWFLIIAVVTMFSSGTIVSEFEDRTALVLFTRPIRKVSIFIGKTVAALVLGILAVSIYFFLSLATVAASTGKIPSYSGLMFLLLVAGTFAATGVSLLISAVVKKGNTAAVLTFFTLLLITNIIYSSLLLIAKVDPWFMIDIITNDLNLVLDMGPTHMDSYVDSSLGIDILYPSYNPYRTVGVCLLWGAVGTTLSYLLFRRKEI